MTRHWTVPQIARLHGAAPWQVRIAVDALGDQVQRAGLYRLVPHELLGQVKAELVRRGYLRETEATGAK